MGNISGEECAGFLDKRMADKSKAMFKILFLSQPRNIFPLIRAIKF
jgi:hypothetical protein